MQDKKYTRRNFPDTSGTSRRGELLATYQELASIFGEAIESCERGTKVALEWNFVKNNGGVVTIYEWKSTAIWDPSLPSLKHFKMSKVPYSWGIGARNDEDAVEFKCWVEKVLQIRREYNL